MKYDLRAHRADGLDFDRIGIFGKRDRRPYAEDSRSVRNGLAVIAAAGGDHPAPALFRRKIGDEIDAAAHFKRADGLMVLMLDVNFRAEQLAQAVIVMQRRRLQIRRDDLTGLEHVGKGDWRR